MYQNKRPVDMMRDWMNIGLFNKMLDVMAEFQSPDDMDKLSDAIDTLKGDDESKHREAMAQLSACMEAAAEKMGDDLKAVKALAKHTAYIANELRGDNSFIYTSRGGSELLGIGIMESITGITTNKGDKEFENDLRVSRTTQFLGFLEERCELEKMANAKILDDDKRKELTENIKKANGKIVFVIDDMAGRVHKGELGAKPDAEQKLKNVAVRLTDEMTALESGWDVTRICDISVINDVLSSNYELQKNIKIIADVPELQNFRRLNEKLNSLDFVDLTDIYGLEKDEKDLKKQADVDKFYVDFYTTLKQMNAEIQKPSVKKAFEKLNAKGAFNAAPNNILSEMMKGEPKYDFALENVNLVKKNYAPQNKEQKVDTRAFNNKLHYLQDDAIAESFRSSLKSFTDEAKAMYTEMAELKKKNPKCSLQFQAMERALIKAKELTADDRSPEEVIATIKELGDAADKYVRERGRKANSTRLGFGKKLAALAADTHIGLGEQISDTRLDDLGNTTLTRMLDKGDEATAQKEKALREARGDKAMLFRNKFFAVKSSLEKSMNVFANDVDHYTSNKSSETFKKLYSACLNVGSAEGRSSTPKQMIDSMYELVQAADAYTAEHDGFAAKGIFSGRDRLAASRDISKKVRDDLNLLMSYYSEISGLMPDESIDRFIRRSNAESANYDRKPEERLNDQQLRDEMDFESNYRRYKTVKNELERLDKSEMDRLDRQDSAEFIIAHIAVQKLIDKHGEKSVLDKNEYDAEKQKLRDEQWSVMNSIAHERESWLKDSEVDHGKIVKRYEEKLLNEKRLQDERKKQEEQKKVEKDAVKPKEVKSAKAVSKKKVKVKTKLEVIQEVDELDDDEPSNAKEEPKKAEKESAKVEFDPKKAKKSPFYTQQKNIYDRIKDGQPKTKEAFETIKDQVMYELSDIIVEYTASAIEKKQLDKPNTINQCLDSSGKVNKMQLSKHIFKSAPMRELAAETKNWDDLVKLGNSALAENAKPFIMNYGIRNHKHFDKQNSNENTARTVVAKKVEKTLGTT